MTLTGTRIALVILSYVLAYLFFARYFGNVYAVFFPESISSSFVPSGVGAWLVGVPLAVIFLLTLLVRASGKEKVWWWVLVSLLPTILFEIAFDILHLYVPVVLGAIAWGLGYLGNKALWRLVPGVMEKIS